MWIGLSTSMHLLMGHSFQTYGIHNPKKSNTKCPPFFHSQFTVGNDVGHAIGRIPSVVEAQETRLAVSGWHRAEQTIDRSPVGRDAQLLQKQCGNVESQECKLIAIQTLHAYGNGLINVFFFSIEQPTVDKIAHWLRWSAAKTHHWFQCHHRWP